MVILAYEFFCASGSPADAPASLRREGYAMLRALLADLLALPGLDVVTVLGSEGMLPPELRSPRLHILRGSGAGEFRRWVRRCDAALLVAPETGGTLASLTAVVQEEGKVVLGSDTRGVRLAGDKAATAAYLARHRIPVPGWQCCALDKVGEVARSLPYPVVVKPVDGAGTSATFLVRDGDHLRRAVEEVGRVSPAGAFLVQEYVRGEAASVSLLVLPQGPQVGTRPPPSPRRVLTLSVNRQFVGVSPDGTFRYSGVEVPYAHPLAEQAAALAAQACSLLPGLGGYVGVDVVLTPTGPVVMEINPRLTDAYIALREVVPANLAGMILDACLYRRLPECPPLRGQAEYRVEVDDGAFRGRS